MLEWLKNIFKRTKRRKVIGYFNGKCPECHRHIGTDVYLDTLGRKRCVCGFCGSNIYEAIKNGLLV